MSSAIFYGIIHPSESDAFFNSPPSVLINPQRGDVTPLKQKTLRRLMKQADLGNIPFLVGHEGNKEMFEYMGHKNTDAKKTAQDIVDDMHSNDWHYVASQVQEDHPTMCVAGKVRKIIEPKNPLVDPWIAEFEVTNRFIRDMIDDGLFTGLSINTVGNTEKAFMTELSLCHDPVRKGCTIIGRSMSNFVYPSEKMSTAELQKVKEILKQGRERIRKMTGGQAEDAKKSTGYDEKAEKYFEEKKEETQFKKELESMGVPKSEIKLLKRADLRKLMEETKGAGEGSAAQEGAQDGQKKEAGGSTESESFLSGIDSETEKTLYKLMERLDEGEQDALVKTLVALEKKGEQTKKESEENEKKLEKLTSEALRSFVTTLNESLKKLPDSISPEDDQVEMMQREIPSMMQNFPGTMNAFGNMLSAAASLASHNQARKRKTGFGGVSEELDSMLYEDSDSYGEEDIGRATKARRETVKSAVPEEFRSLLSRNRSNY